MRVPEQPTHVSAVEATRTLDSVRHKLILVRVYCAHLHRVLDCCKTIAQSGCTCVAIDLIVK